jgi:hypothetical protein
MDELHRRLLQIGFNAGPDLGLVLAGGYALAAHELVDRPSRDIDFATATSIPLPDVAARLADVYRAASYEATIIEATPRMARLLVHAESRTCEVDLLKEAIGPPRSLSWDRFYRSMTPSDSRCAHSMNEQLTGTTSTSRRPMRARPGRNWKISERATLPASP